MDQGRADTTVLPVGGGDADARASVWYGYRVVRVHSTWRHSCVVHVHRTHGFGSFGVSRGPCFRIILQIDSSRPVGARRRRRPSRMIRSVGVPMVPRRPCERGRAACICIRPGCGDGEAELSTCLRAHAIPTPCLFWPFLSKLYTSSPLPLSTAQALQGYLGASLWVIEPKKIELFEYIFFI